MGNALKYLMGTLCLALAACSNSAGPGNPAPGGDGDGSSIDGASPGSDMTGGVGDGDDSTGNGTGVTIPDDENGGSAGSGSLPEPDDGADDEGGAGDVTDATGGMTAGVPCDVAAIMRDSCHTCHGAEPKFGAPMPLVTREDFQADSVLDPTQKVVDRILPRVTADTNRMPPPTSGPALTDDQVASLRTWIEGGLPVSNEVCEDTMTDVPDEPAEDFDFSRCDYELDIRAHANSGPNDTEPFPIKTVVTDYQCFWEEVPWGDTPVHALRIATISGNEQHEHHFVLTGTPQANQQDGDVTACLTAPGASIATSGPGQAPMVAPDGVGFEVPSGPQAFMSVQIHYDNSRGIAGQVDVNEETGERGGMTICATNKLQPNSSAIHWLGSEALGAASVTTDCPATQRTRILAMQVHMHNRGTHGKVEIIRGPGDSEVIIDIPFDFDEQPYLWFDDLWLEPGDIVRSTCEYDTSQGPFAWGLGTNEEMCYMFTQSYPAGALTGGLSLTNLAGNTYACTNIPPDPSLP